MKTTPSLHFEKIAVSQGYRKIAGIDEVGRGCLAGPVVAAAVILPMDHGICGLNDSKLLSPKKREILSKEIYQKALSVGLGTIQPDVIDEVNILEASILAMKKAVEVLSLQPDYLLVDGLMKRFSALPQKCIPKGDRLSESIAAASIVAKVFRDKMMQTFHEKYPQYGLAENKGYPTSHHLEALKTHGITDIHRKTFRGVSEHCS
ncbi:MAG: ribonuclease HII [Deltaproteobacteria bacterium RIFCSPHIGHO2_02_FULL_40_11]|nr:MAG: ribonuclease HII [Deltaproteobacteria bacterium RIFCSPHIGHO2_02_FULL_40_11]